MAGKTPVPPELRIELDTISDRAELYLGSPIRLHFM